MFNQEKEKLDLITEIINKKISKTEDNFKQQESFRIGFNEGMRGTQFIRQGLMSMYATEAINLKSMLANPYFGRMDFKEQDDDIRNIYIGKHSLVDKNNILIYDWRSNICSMYYDYSIGKARYKNGNQTIDGEIINKVQLVIENSKLIDVDYQDVLTDNNILIRYLNGNADSRLKSIVATIQREQNKNKNKKEIKEYNINDVIHN